MPVETREISINGHTVKIVPFNAVRGFTVNARLTKLILPVLGTVLPALTTASSKGAADLSLDDIRLEDFLPAALSKLSESIEPEAFLQLLLDLLSGTFVDGDMIDKAKFDTLFIGNYLFAYQLAFESIQVNRFFDLGDFGKKVLAKFPATKLPKGQKPSN